MGYAALGLLVTGMFAFGLMLLAMYLDFDIAPVITCGGVAVAALVAGGVCAAVQDGREWEAFATAHECVKVGHMSGSTFNTVGIGSNGGVSVGVGSTPDKTGYRCNDGMTYWR